MTSPVERTDSITYWSGVFAGATGAMAPFILTFFMWGGPVWVGVDALSVALISLTSGLILWYRANRGRHFAR